MRAIAVPGRGRALWVDAALALCVTALQVQGTLARVEATGSPRPLNDLGILGIGLVVVSGLALVVRRRWPVAVFAVTAGASLVYYALDFQDGPTWLALFIALYGVTAYGDGKKSLLIAGVGIGVLTVCWLVAAADIEPRAALGWVFFRIGASVMSAALGESMRSRAVIAAEAHARAELAERTRDEEGRARVDAERLRIAREVHDTVAHAIAIINVQAGVTAHVLDKRPEQAQVALQSIEITSARALHEMRAIVGVLRGDGDDRLQHHGLDHVEDLVAKARESGLDVKLDLAVPSAALASAVDSAAYRIVQESMTNVLRHVGPTRVLVVVAAANDTLEIRVTDDGPPTPRSDADNGMPMGRGLLGMRERCQLLGGDMQAGPTSDGGFTVVARLPLAPTASRL